MEAYYGTALFQFIDKFKTEEDCKAYLFDIKFSQGFCCSKCNNKTSYNGVKPYTKVCKQCRHTESSTSNTLFHKVKFGLRTAFHIIYDMTTTANGISSLQVSRKYNIEYNTAWLFMKKVRLSMESSGSYPMTGKVYVDEYVIGGYEQGVVGRTNDSKKTKVIMAVECTNQNRIKRCYNLKLENYSSNELGKIFTKHISKEAKVYTDEWKGYIPLKQHYDIVMDKKTKTNSPVNRMIQQTKSWIRGTHHSISKFHSITYLDEYSFRLNRSQHKETIFHKCIERMVVKEKRNRMQVSQLKLKSREEFTKKVKMYSWLDIPYQVRYGKVIRIAA